MHVQTTESVHRVAITGGRGRLAQLIASFLRSRGYEVVLFSRSEGDGFKKLADLLDPIILSHFTLILHTAWSTLPFTSEEDPGREYREDLPFLKRLLESITQVIDMGIVPKFIFFSSASVYGNTRNNPVTEKIMPHPISRYAQAKLAAEEMILTRAQEIPLLEPVVLRITNILGLLSNPKYPQGLLPRMIAVGRSNETLTIWGDGRCSKDYLWIDDFLLAIEAMLHRPVCGIFNIGSGENWSLVELLALVEAAMQVTLKVHYRDPYLWDVMHSSVDSSKFSQVTGWRPKKKIAEEVKKLLA
jgi:nucleoside-diphosphate-sugar epimerase